MENLLKILHKLPEYAMMADTLKKSRSVAVTGLSQINRSHFVAGVRFDMQKPMLLITESS